LRIVLAGVACATGLLAAHAVHAQCLGNQNVSLTAPTTPIDLSSTITVTWDFHGWNLKCDVSSVQLYYRDTTTGISRLASMKGSPVPSRGSVTEAPQSSGTYFLRAFEHGGTAHTDVGSAPVTVVLPQVNGVTTVDITAGSQKFLFAQAIAADHAVVRIAGDVDLDLSGLSFLQVAPGVQILGDRSMFRAGPRLFTTTFPRMLLVIGGVQGPPSDDVRISGIRLDGGEADDPFTAVGTEDADGIAVFASTNVQIDHNEIDRWRGTAVNVHDGNAGDDPHFVGRINRDNANTVWIHDNYIHHNQHPTADNCGTSLLKIDGDGHAAGYGVNVSDGAYALIEHNVFDWNRHSIAGDGKAGTGYLAFGNLVLQNGGVHFRCLDSDDVLATLASFLIGSPAAAVGYDIWQALDGDKIYHTHAIDMHGRGSDGFGGQAGEFMDIELNTILYTAGNAIRLRGTPTDAINGMTVRRNVFAHEDRFGGEFGGALSPGAMVEDESGLHESDNRFGVDTFADRKSCDFDGDGTPDPLIATGVALWYFSSALGGRWVFLAQSPADIEHISFGDFDMDGRCDAEAGGQKFLSTDPLPFARNPGNQSTVIGEPARLDLVATGGSRPYAWTVSGLPPGLSADVVGRIFGTPTAGSGPSYRVTASASDVNHQIGRVAFDWSVTARVPNVVSETLGDAQTAVRSAGLAVGRVSYTSSCVDAGSVMTESPAAGTTAPIGSQVNLTVSRCSSGGGHSGGGGSTHPK
jgi:hypothetical protein